MKDKLAILDFDETIKENVENVSGPNIKDFFPNRTYPPDIQELIHGVEMLGIFYHSDFT